MDSKKYILGAFLAACAAIVVSFTLPFYEQSFNEDCETYQRDPEWYDNLAYGTLSYPFIGYSIVNSSYLKVQLEEFDKSEEKLDEMLEEAADYPSRLEELEETQESLEEAKSGLIKNYVFFFAADVMFLLFIVVIAISAYLYGVYDRADSKHLSFKTLRYVAVVPLVIVVAFFLFEDSLICSRQTINDIVQANDLHKYTFNFIPLLAVTAVMAVCGFMVKPKQVE